MKKTIIISILFLVSFLSIPVIHAEGKITLYLFHGETCPHCAEAREYLNEVLPHYPTVSMVLYEVWNDEANAKLWQNVKDTLETDSRGVPFIVIGERYLTGFGEYRKKDITNALDYYVEHPNEYRDIVEEVSKSGVLKDQEKAEIHPIMMDTKAEEDKKKIFFCGIGVIVLLIIYILLGRKKESSH